MVPWVSLVLATIAGWFYGLAYIRTRSILAAARMHTMADRWWVRRLAIAFLDKISSWDQKTMLKVGSRAPEFALPMLDSEEVSLTQLLQVGKQTLLVFLRHLG